MELTTRLFKFISFFGILQPRLRAFHLFFLRSDCQARSAAFATSAFEHFAMRNNVEFPRSHGLSCACFASCLTIPETKRNTPIQIYLCFNQMDFIFVYSQRSPVLVSLLPTSKEASPWFLDRTKALPLSER